MNSRKEMNSSEMAGDLVCPSCGEKRINSRTEEEPFLYGVGTNAVELRASIQIRKCADCGFEFTDDAAESSRHEAVCRYLGVLTPEEILHIRKLNGLSRAEFAKLTRIGEASLHRWENGLLIQNPAMDSYLRLLAFPDNMERLRRESLPCSDLGSGERRTAVPIMHRQQSPTERDNVVPFKALRQVTEEEALIASTWKLIA
jgi:putative zinc finger/helix-turn-helix YgiT family protein